MRNKFPQKAISKWKRFNNLEKLFMGYCLILFLSIFPFPIFYIENANGNFNNYFIFDLTTSFIIVVFMLLFLITRNISFRFKKLINLLIGFKENDALMNFGILFVLTITYINIANTVGIIQNNYLSGSSMTLGYYITGTLLIIGLVRNIFLGLNLSKSKNNKNNMVNIINKENNKEKEEIKGLFE